MSIASLANPTANPQQLADMLSRLSPEQLQAYAQAHQDDMMVVSMVMAEQSRRQKQSTAMQGNQPQPMPVRDQVLSQGLPEDSGIAQLPAPNMQNMAGGGIVAFAGGKEVKGDPKARFMEEYGPAAEYAGDRLGVDPQILLAQWGLESRWGTGKIAPFNPGNMKAGKNQEGVRLYDKVEKSNDKYVPFKSPEEFGAAYADRIARLWPDAMGAGSDAAKYAEALTSGKRKYATDEMYVSKLANTYKGLGGTPQAQAAPSALSYSPSVAAIPGAKPDERQSFMGPAAPPAPDRDFGGAGRALGAAEGLLGIASGIPAMPIAAIKSLLGDKSFQENLASSVYAPRTETGQGVVRGFGEVAEALKLPAFVPTVGSAGQGARAVAAAQKAAKEAEALAALTGQKVATPRLASIPADTSAMGRMRSGLEDIARRDVDQAAATAAANEARLAPLNVQQQMMRAGDAATGTRYAQEVAGRTGKTGRLGLAAAAGSNAPLEEIPTGLAAAAQAAPVTPEDLSKDEKKELVDTAKATVPASERKKTGFNNDDWMMLGLQLLASNTGTTTPFEALGKAGIATLGSKKEREKAEREQESQKFIDELRQSQAKLAGAQAEYFGEDKKVREAVAEADKMYKNWLATEKANKMTSMELTPEKAAAAEQRFLREAYERYKIPLPPSFGAVGTAAVPKLPAGAVTRVG